MKTNDARHRGMSDAVMGLRARMRWGQSDLANEITRTAGKMGMRIAPNQGCISRWENCEASLRRSTAWSSPGSPSGTGMTTLRSTSAHPSARGGLQEDHEQ